MFVTESVSILLLAIANEDVKKEVMMNALTMKLNSATGRVVLTVVFMTSVFEVCGSTYPFAKSVPYFICY